MAVGGEICGGDSLSIAFVPSEFPDDDDRWGRSRAGLQRAIQYVRTTNHETGYMNGVFGYLRSGQGLQPGVPLGDGIEIRFRIIRKGEFPLLGRLRLQVHGGRPFLLSPMRGELLSSSSSSSSSEERVSVSSDTMSEVPLRQRPPLPPCSSSGPSSRRLIRRQNQHPRQQGNVWVFG